ncbi:hypothetical protein EXN66_Car009887 [Channa argus]|uniref:Uncharacterized protein n=1 Tax=Channa argus TaxID=215402 RepID=A0A6G1PV46_CHAAH|nr:hypothetical protein EXN66_Car009887 [Channa argus]
MRGYDFLKDFINVGLADPDPEPPTLLCHFSFLQLGAKKMSHSESAIPISAISELLCPKSFI